MAGRHYNHDMQPEMRGDPRRLIAESVARFIAADCTAGVHRRTETDAATGDEVCRYCGTVVEYDQIRPERTTDAA